MKQLSPLLILLTMTACAGAKLEQQKNEIEDLQTKAGSYLTQLKERADEIEALKARKTDLEAKLDEIQGRAAAAEGRVATLTNSNKSLSDAIGASRDELGDKLNMVVAEKDDLDKKLADALKEKVALERLKAGYQSTREKAGRELAKLKEEREGLLAKLAEAEAAYGKSAAEDRKAGEARAAAVLKTREDMSAIADAVLKEMQAGKARVEQNGDSFTITVDDGAIFEDGAVKVTEQGAALLGRIGAGLKILASKIVRVEAHSDNAPFKKDMIGGYLGHWELTAARATAVVRWLNKHAGLDPARLTAAGFGEFRPAKPNDTPEGRAANRRVVIVVSPMN